LGTKKIASITLKLMANWLGCVWACQPGALSKPQGMLGIDAFHGYLSKRIRNWLQNTEVVILVA
jgi:hypothetical protein